MSHHLEDPFKIKQQKYVSTRGVKLTKEFRRKMFFSRVLNVLTILAMIGLASLMAIVFFKGPISNNDSWIVPDRTKTISIDDKIIATDAHDSILTRLEEAVITPSKLFIGKVVAGPNGVMIGTDGDYSIHEDGGGPAINKSNLELRGSHDQYLKDEYILRCESGDCKVGQDYLLKKSQVKGIYTPKKSK